MAALFGSRQAIIIRAPRLARSIAVSLPIPVLAPVMITVLPVSRFVLVQIPIVYIKYILRPPRIEITTNPICTRIGNEKKYANIMKMLSVERCDVNQTD